MTYKFINFILIEQKPKTGVWACVNNSSGDTIGIVKWYPSWRQYCYFPGGSTVYSKGCLEDIIDFMESLRK